VAVAAIPIPSGWALAKATPYPVGIAFTPGSTMGLLIDVNPLIRKEN
jgi:hypothetical protein